MRRHLGAATLLALASSACGAAGGPGGRYVTPDPDPDPDAGIRDTGTMTSTVPDAGHRRPGCPAPTLESIRAEIFLPKCGTPTCHGGAEELDLTLPIDALRPRLLQPSTQSPSRLPLIAPSEVGRSWLYLKVFLDQPLAGDRMPPPPDPPLTDCQKEAIEEWIKSGAP
jgi:hypothetical protein